VAITTGKKMNKLMVARADKKGNCSTPFASRTMRGGSIMNAFSSKTHLTDTVSDLLICCDLLFKIVFNDIGVKIFTHYAFKFFAKVFRILQYFFF
jgi:hypothetical protein